MNKQKIVLFLMVGILAFSACEKDDICVDADTPRLVVRFYDITDTTEFKDVQNLIVRGLTTSGAQDTIINSALDSIVLPLRVNENSTSFTLSRQTSIDDINIDTITFTYEAKEIFISRACGYIVNFDGLQTTVVQDDSVWIQETRIITPLIENTASAHVKILH
ncbi:DUF6452 family protein [Pareuzebyella sediminis]|uniref:DUF6452 family protein n=1 Tax=Pareuzebyella sediminis TaxID=2607998 RepID=UPI0011EC04EE|nr:DUF6452 family protein [Pareuzebyella sediminis]